MGVGQGRAHLGLNKVVSGEFVGGKFSFMQVCAVH